MAETVDTAAIRADVGITAHEDIIDLCDAYDALRAERDALAADITLGYACC